MNILVNDKLPSLPRNTNASQENKTISLPSGGMEPTAKRKSGEDSLDLSSTGQLLQQSARTQSENASYSPETAAQASALVAEIRSQFELSGSTALEAHSGVRAEQIDLLLSSAPV